MTETPQPPPETGQRQHQMPPQTPARGKAIEVRVDRPITDLDQAWRFAVNIATANVLPYTLKGKPADVFAVMAYGSELGLSPMKSIQGIYVVKGKPQLSSDLYQALILRRGHKVRWGHCDRESATVTIIRADDPKGEHPVTRTFTIQDAETAGLLRIVEGKVQARSTKDGKTEILPWERYTQRMLENRALSFAGKKAAPEVAFGFGVEGDYDYIDTDATDIEVGAPAMHQEPMSQTDLQQAFAAAEQDLGSVTPNDDAPEGTTDAEVVEDQAADDQGDSDDTLFAGLDAQADEDLSGDRDE